MNLPLRLLTPSRLALGVFLGALGLLIAPQDARAHQEDDPGGDEAYRPGFEPDSTSSEQYAAFELRLGPYIPEVDDGLTAQPYDEAFGDNPSVTVGFEVDYQALHIPHFGSLGPGFGWHWFRKSGIAQFTDGTEGSAHKNSLWIMPMFAVAVLRVDFLAHDYNIPLVPYIKGGFAWSIWESRDAGSVSTANGDRAQGSSFGLQYQLGLMIHLNPIDRQTAIDLDNASGINNSYLFIEWWASDVDSFGAGMQTGDATWVAGLALEY